MCSLCVLPGEYIALYQSQRAIMKQKHHEKEQYISMLAQDKEEMKVLYMQRFFIENQCGPMKKVSEIR